MLKLRSVPGERGVNHQGLELLQGLWLLFQPSWCWWRGEVTNQLSLQDKDKGFWFRAYLEVLVVLTKVGHFYHLTILEFNAKVLLQNVS